MLEALYEIGKLQPQEGLLNEIAEDVGDDYKHVFKIVFEIKEDKIPVFKEIGYEEFSTDKKLKYFYKKGSSRGCDKTPTSKFNGDIKKVFDNKIAKNICNFIKDNSISNSKFLESLNGEVEAKTEEILQKLNDVIDSYKIVTFVPSRSVILQI